MVLASRGHFERSRDRNAARVPGAAGLSIPWRYLKGHATGSLGFARDDAGHAAGSLGFARDDARAFLFLPFVCCILLVVSACFSSAQTPSESVTGIEGVITISPSRPGPARVGIPSSAPVAKTAFAVENKAGVVASLTTDEEGRFRVLLSPGHYTVSLKDRKGGIGRFGPWDVDVVAGKVTKVEWQCDSGMR
jgi:hypothetical protein